MRIFIPVVLAFLFVGCSDNVQDAQKVEATQAVAKEETEAIAQLKAKAIKEEVAKQNEIPQPPSIPTIPTAEIVKAVEKVKIEASNEVEALKQVVDEGKTLYIKCAACHGSNGEKAALAKSQIIKGWSVAKVTEALNGYKNGTYGNAMKAVMKGQASGLSDTQIKSLAEYISSL